MKIKSENDVVELLKTRQAVLRIELERIEQALAIFHNSGVEKLENDSPGHKLRAELSELSRKDLLIPEEYDQNYKWDTKVLFALSQRNYSFKEDVISKICELEKGVTSDTIKNIVSVKLSSLLKERIIGATKKGRKFEYFLL